MAVEMNKYDFDPDDLAKKYRIERDKRLRQDGNEQYQEVSGEFSYFAEDPYINTELERDPLEDEVEVIIIGGGFGGMLAAVRLMNLLTPCSLQVHARFLWTSCQSLFVICPQVD